MSHKKRKTQLEFLRSQAKQKFDKIRQTWIDLGRWALPHRIKWMLSQNQGERNNQHIVDGTHILALRSFVAGFLEGNTSATRPWFRIGTQDPALNEVPANREWLQKLTERCLKVLLNSNFYHAAGRFYFDLGVFNTGTHYIDELEDGSLYFHTLTPGSYYVLINDREEPIVLVRDYSLTVNALVSRYGEKNEEGKISFSNFSNGVRKMYEDGNWDQMVDVVHIVIENDEFNPTEPEALLNMKWIEYSYEVGETGVELTLDPGDGSSSINPDQEFKFLRISGRKRRPFIVGKGDSSDFPYGEKGPTLDALGIIKSLNKKAIGKDQALEQMLKPALQGPATIKKSYITTASNSYVPLDARSLSDKGLRPIFEVNPGLGALIQDVGDLRQQVDKFYFADFLLFLSNNPKTRTATETDAIVKEQQLVVGPNLQSLNLTYNVPLVDFVSDFVIDQDPFLPPPPEALIGKFLRPEFISVFAQAQKAADLPSVDRYIAMISNVGQIDPRIFDKANLDKLADIYEDRLFLPAGLNNPQDKVDAIREQKAQAAQTQQMVQETVPALSKAAKDVGLQVNQ